MVTAMSLPLPKLNNQPATHSEFKASGGCRGSSCRYATSGWLSRGFVYRANGTGRYVFCQRLQAVRTLLEREEDPTTVMVIEQLLAETPLIATSVPLTVFLTVPAELRTTTS